MKNMIISYGRNLEEGCEITVRPNMARRGAFAVALVDKNGAGVAYLNRFPKTVESAKALAEEWRRELSNVTLTIRV